jgi:hypothetical protein
MPKKRKQPQQTNALLTPEQMKTLAKRRETLVGAESAPRIYSNNVSISVSPWDIRLRFGQIEEATPEKLVVRELVTIFLSPQHAKLFSDLLAQKMAQYDEIAQSALAAAAQIQKASDEEAGK